MTGTSSSPVVVGVDGSPGSLTAVRYAVDEAARLGTGVRLVHVEPDYAPTTPMLPLIRDDFEQVGRRILAGSAPPWCADVAPECETTTVLRSGSTVTTLLEAAEDAHLSSSDASTTPRSRRSSPGRRRSAWPAVPGCPVVSVPPTGPARGVARPGRGRRPVARPTPPSCSATPSRRPRRAGSGWSCCTPGSCPAPTTTSSTARTHAHDRVRDVESQIDPLLDVFRRSHPDVEVELAVVHEQPVQRAPPRRRAPPTCWSSSGGPTACR